MTNCVGFPPIARRDARVLILGTLPGAESLRQQQYYAYRQNSFWKIMGELIGASTELSYHARCSLLKKNRIALWDVCAAAWREGSLDTSIQKPMPNDFLSFFRSHKTIASIAFNGQPAAKLFTHLVAPQMPKRVLALPRVILPSTSPAHAGMPCREKLRRWRDTLTPLIETNIR